MYGLKKSKTLRQRSVHLAIAVAELRMSILANLRLYLEFLEKNQCDQRGKAYVQEKIAQERASSTNTSLHRSRCHLMLIFIFIFIFIFI